MKQKIQVCRKEHFNAAHRLHTKEWDDETNKLFFGKCNSVNYHGHNYELIVKIAGYVNPITGYLIDMGVLSKIIHEYVLTKFDHKNLNLDIPEFETLNPTAENIAIVIWQLLRPQISQDLDLKIVLFETEKNYVEYPY